MHRRGWSSPTHPPLWTSGGVALLATSALFAVAFLAMGTVRGLPLLSSRADDVTAPTIIRFIPPVAKPVPPPTERPRATAVPRALQAPATVPTTTGAPVTTAPVTAPLGSARDSGVRVDTTSTSRRITDLTATRAIPNVPAAPSGARAAPLAPSGVTANWNSLTEEQRDSIAEVKAAALQAMIARGLTREPTDEEKRRLSGQAEPGKALPNTRAGGAAPLMNGGASMRMPVGSISAPLFSRKPLPPEPLEARQLRLRLAERAKAKRDSLRADSIAKSQIRP